jgi:hypothetical protein
MVLIRYGFCGGVLVVIDRFDLGLLLSLRRLWWRNLGISVYLGAYLSQASLYLCLLASGTPCNFCDGLWTKFWHLLAVPQQIWVLDLGFVLPIS